MEVKHAGYLKTPEVAKRLRTTAYTVSRWYKWWDNSDYEKPDGLYLPPYYHLDRTQTKFFKKEDIPKLRAFQKALNSTHWSAMAEFNAANQWGAKGRRILKQKEGK